MQARLPLLLLPLLAACASAPDRDYPSLAIRDGERLVGTFMPAPYVPPAPAESSLVEASTLADRARAAHARFVAALPRATSRARAARGAAPGSDAWSDAQVAVADLEGHRAQVMITLADLDRIYVETSSEGQAIAPVEDERGAIEALVAQETAAIDELLALLR